MTKIKWLYVMYAGLAALSGFAEDSAGIMPALGTQAYGVYESTYNSYDKWREEERPLQMFLDDQRRRIGDQMRKVDDLLHKGQQTGAKGNDLVERHDTSRQSDRPQSVESVNCEADHKTEGQSSDWSFPMWLRAIGLVVVGLILFRLFK